MTPEGFHPLRIPFGDGAACAVSEWGSRRITDAPRRGGSGVLTARQRMCRGFAAAAATKGLSDRPLETFGRYTCSTWRHAARISLCSNHPKRVSKGSKTLRGVQRQSLWRECRGQRPLPRHSSSSLFSFMRSNSSRVMRQTRGLAPSLAETMPRFSISSTRRPARA